MNQQLLFKATGLSLTDALREYTSKRLLSVFTKYPIRNDAIHVELGKISNHHKHGEIYFAEASFYSGVKKIFARSKENDMYTAIDKLHNEINKQLEMSKGKRLALFRRGSQKIKKMMKLDFS